MEIMCSVCQLDDDLKLLKSTVMPGARYIACAGCREVKWEPRPLIVLGAIYGDVDVAKQFIREHRYVGEDIRASEIL